MKLFSSLLFIIIPLITLSGCSKSPEGYAIKLNLTGTGAGDSLMLSRMENSKPVILQKVPAGTGKVQLTGAHPLLPGMYACSISRKGSFDFLVSDTLHQKFSVACDVKNILSSLVFENSDENTAFTEFRRFLDNAASQQKMLQLRMRRNSSYPDSINRINESFMQLNQEMMKQTENLKKEFPGSMLALYTGLISEPRVPEPAIPPAVTNRQQFMQDYYFNYISSHFFDNFDFSDPRIVTIPVFEEKIGFFFRQMTPPLPDSIMGRTEMLIEKSNRNDAVYNHTVRYLYRLFRESSLPELMDLSDKIGETYILADPDRWNDEPFVSKVRDRVTRARLNPVGAVATDLKLKKITGETLRLSDTRAPLTILYFFNPECDACGPVTDQLVPVYNRVKNQGVAVFGVYLDKKTDVWKNYIAEKKLDWINVYDPDGAEGIEARYDIYAIPMIYLLGPDKKIIARDVPVNALEELILQNLR